MVQSMSDIPTKYYHKELFSTPLFLNRGVKAPFEAIGNDEGLLATADPSLIFSMENAISRHVGGVTAINKEAYDQFKKKEKITSKSRDLLPQFRAVPEQVGPVVSAYLPSQNQSPAAVGENPIPDHQRTTAPIIQIEPGKAGKMAKKGKAPVFPA